MKQFYLKFYTLLLCLVIGGGNVWADTMSVDFESDASDYSGWTFTNMTTKQTNSGVSAHGGDYFGTTGGKATASITTNNKISPSSITFYVSKQTTNTTASSWKVQVSSDGTKWTDVKTQSATSMSKGDWVEVTQNLTSYSNVFVRVYYDGTTAVRCIDDLVLTYTPGGNQEKKSLSPFANDTYSLSANSTGNISDLVSIPSDYDGTITYSSSDEDVIIIDSDGSYLVGDAGTATISATASETSTYKAVSQEVTIKVVANYTITWNVNGETTTTQVQEGAQINFVDPSNKTIEGKQFVGWVSEEITGITDVAPSFVTSATADNSLTYYAVYANSVGGEEYLTKITDAANITNGVYAIITFDEAYYLANNKATSAPGVDVVEKSNDKIIISESMKWTLSKYSGGVIKLQSFADMSIYLWGAPTNEGVRIVDVSTKKNATKEWYVTNTDDYGVVLYNVESQTTKRYLSTYGTQDWRNYTSTSTTNRAANLYKVSGGISYSNYCTTVPEQQTLSLVAELGSNYYATFSSENAVEFENDVVYTVSASGETLNITPVASKQVPANTGVLIKSENNAENYFGIDSADELNGNMLKAASTPMEGSYSFYKLAYDNYSEKTGLGFYYGEEGGAAFKCKVGTAYLAVPTGSNVKSFVFADDATAVKSVAVPTVDANAPVYNMAGQRVSANTKGIVFQNGKKYFNK